MPYTVGQKVTHVDYPEDVGTVISKMSKRPGELPMILVRWEHKQQVNHSRHIPFALRPAKHAR